MERSTVSPNFGNSLNVSFNADDRRAFGGIWSFAAADAQVLVPGSYKRIRNDSRFKLRDTPGWIFPATARGCNQSTGRFDILELTRDSAGQITSLAINFEQHCEGGRSCASRSVPLQLERATVSPSRCISLCSRRSIPAAVLRRRGPMQHKSIITPSDVRDAQGGQQLSYAWTSSTRCPREFFPNSPSRRR